MASRFLFVGRADHPRVDLDALVAPTPLDGLLAERRRSCLRRRGSPDFAENGAVIRLLESGPIRRSAAPGERSLLMAEELALEQLRGERGAVDGRRNGPLLRGQSMERLCHEFLAGTAFALDEHSGAGRRHLPDTVVNLHHDRRIADQLLQAELLVQLLPQLPVLRLDLAECSARARMASSFARSSGLVM